MKKEVYYILFIQSLLFSAIDDRIELMSYKDVNKRRKKRRIFIKRLLHKLKEKRYSIGGIITLVLIAVILVNFLDVEEKAADSGNIITFEEPWSIVESALSIVELDIHINPGRKKQISENEAENTDIEADVPMEAYESLEDYIEDCIFLGDSRSVALVSYGFVSDSNVLAEVGISHVNVLGKTFTQKSGKQYSVSTFLESHAEQNIYVGFGVNGMDYLSESEYEASYEALIDEIKKYAGGRRIVLMSVWPVNDEGKYHNTLNHEWVDKYNEVLQSLAVDKEIDFLDFDALLKDADGRMMSEFDSGDGLHYNKEAYEKIIEYIYENK